VPDADHRHPLAQRGVDGVDDVLAAVDAHRPAHDGGVGAEGDRGGALHGAAGGEDPGGVAGGQLLHRPGVEEPEQAVLGVARIDRGQRRRGVQGRHRISTDLGEDGGSVARGGVTRW
jgi:hypothetical protein